jgi:hypothetical protein
VEAREEFSEFSFQQRIPEVDPEFRTPKPETPIPVSSGSESANCSLRRRVRLAHSAEK